jgi:outer membrane lipoprotein LolB
MKARAVPAVRFGTALLTGLLLAACATAPLAPREPTPFDLLGRALVTYRGGAVTANVRWEHSAERDEIWLMTPTGQTLAHIIDNPAGATLTRHDQQQFRAANVEALTRQALGWTLPVTLLQHWLRGVPAPGSAAQSVERGPADRPVALTQNGWRVAFTYHAQGALAGKVRRLDLNDGANEIRFVVDTWRELDGR